MAHEYVKNSRPQRHCGGVVAYTVGGCLYVKCRKCKKWVNIGSIEDLKKGNGHNHIHDINTDIAGLDESNKLFM